jgi:outer membrane protein assembly factor BamB
MKTLKFTGLLTLGVILFTLQAATAATVTLNKAVGPPTTLVTVGGTSFGLEEAVDVYFDTTDMLLVATDTTGKFTGAVLKVPRGAEPGKHWITAVGRKSGKAAQKAFTVRTDWAQFRRAPAHLGFNAFENVLNVTNVSGLAQAWAAPTGGDISSSPAVAGGVVYVGSKDDKLYAFNAATGALKSGFPATTGSDIYSSPAVANGVVYVGSIDGKLYAFNAATGATKSGFPVTTGGAISYSSPAVAGGVVYVGSHDGKLYAFNAASGATRAGFPVSTGAGIRPSPAVANGVVYVGSDDHKLYAFNAATGALKAGFPVTTGGAIYSSPAVANGVVYVGSDDGNLYALSTSNGALLFAAATGGPIGFSSPAVADGNVYVGSGDDKLYAYNLDAGYYGPALKAQRAASAQRPDPAHLVPNYSLEPVPSSEEIEE